MAIDESNDIYVDGDTDHQWLWLDGHYTSGKVFRRCPVDSNGIVRDMDGPTGLNSGKDDPDIWEQLPDDYEHCPLEVSVQEVGKKGYSGKPLPNDLILHFLGDFEEDEATEWIPLEVIRLLAKRLNYSLTFPAGLTQLSPPGSEWTAKDWKWVRRGDRESPHQTVYVKQGDLFVHRNGNGYKQTLVIPFETVVLEALVNSGWVVGKYGKKAPAPKPQPKPSNSRKAPSKPRRKLDTAECRAHIRQMGLAFWGKIEDYFEATSYTPPNDPPGELLDDSSFPRRRRVKDEAGRIVREFDWLDYKVMVQSDVDNSKVRMICFVDPGAEEFTTEELKTGAWAEHTFLMAFFAENRFSPDLPFK